MKKTITLITSDQKLWEKKDVYEVWKDIKHHNIYRCVTTTRTEAEILEILKERFYIKDYPVTIYKNGKMIARWNNKQMDFNNTPVYDMEAKFTFANLAEFMSALEISRPQAMYRLKTQKRYKWKI